MVVKERKMGNLRMKAIAMCFCLSLGLVPHGALSSNKPSRLQGNSRIETVSLCELAKEPERYANKLIRTNGIFLTGFPDVRFMYDEDCSDEKNRIADYLNCKTDSECERLIKCTSLHRNGDTDRWRNKMVVVGELQIEFHKSTDTRVLRFAISDIESVSAVPPTVPWPAP
jgi:hypothetical protein